MITKNLASTSDDEKKFEQFVDAGFTWGEIDDALVYGLHGLPGGSSLAEFLEERGRYDLFNDRSLAELLEEHRMCSCGVTYD